MNKRMFALGLLVSALPLLAQAKGQPLAFTASDFTSARPVEHHGETYLSVKLSKSGKAKLRKLNEHLGEKVHSSLAGVERDFTLRVPITGSSLELGPYSHEEAEKIVRNENLR